ncbi:MAG: DUF1015 domain-containing protein [Desulfomonilaceae bacterium]
MAEVKPFQSVHYGPGYSHVLQSLITPPYDVISPEQQDSFYESHPFNVIRLVLGKQFDDDTPENNRYTRAADILKQWMRDEVLVRKTKPCFTLYQMDFKEPDGTVKRIDGIIGLVKVEDYGIGKVLPHEKTYSGPKRDQLELLRACRANLTPIHAMFDDPDQTVYNIYHQLLATRPEQETRDVDDTTHRTWSIYDEKSIQQIIDFLHNKSLLIADGHHRYETALAYCREVESQNPGITSGPHKYVMAYLTSMTHPGLTILAAHRMLKNLSNFNKDLLLKRIDECFEIYELDHEINDVEIASKWLSLKLQEFARVGGHFGMLINGEKKFRLLKMKESQIKSQFLDNRLPEILTDLDVTILRELILRYGFGVAVEDSEDVIEYTPSIEEAVTKTVLGEVQVSFILNPTRVDQMEKAAELGYKMPHKSTYFYPKISSGLVFNVF